MPKSWVSPYKNHLLSQAQDLGGVRHKHHGLQYMPLSRSQDESKTHNTKEETAWKTRKASRVEGQLLRRAAGSMVFQSQAVKFQIPVLYLAAAVLAVLRLGLRTMGSSKHSLSPLSCTPSPCSARDLTTFRPRGLSASLCHLHEVMCAQDSAARLLTGSGWLAGTRGKGTSA